MNTSRDRNNVRQIIFLCNQFHMARFFKAGVGFMQFIDYHRKADIFAAKRAVWITFEMFIAKVSALPGVAYSRNGADLRIFGAQFAAKEQVKSYGLKIHTFASFTRCQAIC